MDLDAPRGTDRVVRRLAALLREPPVEAPRVEPFDPLPPPARVVAVDGSSVVLAESGEGVLAAYRAGSVGVERGIARPPRVPVPEVVLVPAKDATSALYDLLEEAGVELPPAALPRLDGRGAVDALRLVAETQVAMKALDELAPGDLLLVDGALQTSTPVPTLGRVLARASERGVDVVGVCKSTSLSIGGASALVACQLAARGARTWIAPLPTPLAVEGQSFAARLSPAEARPFRFDVMSARDPRAVVASLAGLCGHPAYPGYPSPLAMAHNAVILTEDAKRRMRAYVQEAVLKEGVTPDAWEAAFVDYHEVLELGA